MRVIVALALVALMLAASTQLVAAPEQRFMKITLCEASGRTFEDCASSTPLTAWDRAYDALFR